MRIGVLGAGNSGLAMSAHLAKMGCEVFLWNRTKSHIKKLIETKTIHCKGIIEGRIVLREVTDDLLRIVNDVDLVMITTPADSYEEIGRLIALNMTKSVPILLNPGRTYGAIRMEEILRKNGLPFTPEIAETQTILYACRKDREDLVRIYALKNDVLIASRKPETTRMILSQLPSCISSVFRIADSIPVTSFGNVGMVLHCAPLLLNAGWTENSDNTYKYYYDGITPVIGAFIEKIDAERVGLAKLLGIEIETTKEWMERSYHIRGESLYQCIRNNTAYMKIDAPRSLKHRYITEDIPYGMVQVEKTAKLIGFETKNISLVIDLAEQMLGEDFRKAADWLNEDILSELRKEW